jgi:hypothetical protein
MARLPTPIGGAGRAWGQWGWLQWPPYLRGASSRFVYHVRYLHPNRQASRSQLRESFLRQATLVPHWGGQALSGFKYLADR